MRIILLVLFLLAGCTAQSPAPPPQPLPSPTPESPSVNAAIYPSTIGAGTPISMAVELNAGATDLSLLRLSITYPSGHTQTVVESIYGDTATLSWTVPQESGNGTATYRLSSEGCGCGPDDKGPTSPDRNRSVAGEFIIN